MPILACLVHLENCHKQNCPFLKLERADLKKRSIFIECGSTLLFFLLRR